MTRAHDRRNAPGRRLFPWIVGVIGLGAFSLSCSSTGSSGAFPWPLESTRKRVLPGLRSASVFRESRGRDRVRGRVMVRHVNRATRAKLDVAAYAQNPILHNPNPPEGMTLRSGEAKVQREKLFDLFIDVGSIVSELKKTPLTQGERREALAFEPLTNYLARWKAEGAKGLEEARSAVKEETWGLKRRPGVFFPEIALLYLHAGAGGKTELWIKIEFQPWAHLFSKMPDADNDGYPEVYARLRAGLFGQEALARIAKDYRGRVLSTKETHRWANELASYWYPSQNTDIVPLGASKVWPTKETDAAVKALVGKQEVTSPTIVIKGKPQGRILYNVFCIAGVAPLVAKIAAGSGALALLPDLKSYAVKADKGLVKLLEQELTRHGIRGFSAPKAPVEAGRDATVGDEKAKRAKEARAWRHWARAMRPFHRELRRQLHRRPKRLNALLGRDGFVFYRKSLDFVVGGDIQAQKAGRNPFSTIVAFKEYLAKLGVDFLLVPIPTKAEVFPDKLRRLKIKAESLPILNPYARKFFLELSRAGVEVVDLLPVFLDARRHRKAGEEPLYQSQDTHWTDRGLRLASKVIAERIKRYAWYSRLQGRAVAFTDKRVTFKRYGDLRSRLATKEQKAFRPQTLVGHRVFDLRTQKPYDDDPRSPIVMLGDSFTGVYERTYCENAGVSAHVALKIQYSLDLVMSYGGGPNVRKKLLSRGEKDLKKKRLLIWLFASRDLYNYWEDWA
ncbi:MAG: hypothetical protein KAI47_17360, partial [Deltaproteobacteria bacterium]|nr:hypothetical protein [Deltaproteobacteria bacterium]